MSDTAWRAAPLVWGHGPKLLEAFLEPTCPFSVKAFGKFDALMAAAGAERLTLRIWMQSQPWHLFSGIVVRCVLAASTLPAGKDAAKAVLAAVAADREAFEFEHHCGGPNLQATPLDVIRRIEGHCGFELTAAFSLPDLDREIKRHCRYGRQNGIHTSPSFMVDGLVEAKMSSGDPIPDWLTHLGLLPRQAGP